MSRYKLSVTAAAAALALTALVGCKPAQPPEQPAQAAASAPVTGEVTRAAIAPGIYELAYSARQKAVFVASTGGFGDNAAAPKILRLDPTTLEVQHEIVLEQRGFGVVLDDARDRLYVGHSLDAAISVIDTTSNQVVGTLQLQEKVKDEEGRERAPHHLREMVVDTEGQRLYAPGLSGSEDSVLFIVNTADLSLVKTISGFGRVATGIALDVAAQRVFVSNLDGEIYTVDTHAEEIVNKYDAGGDQPLNLAFDGETRRLYATDQGLESIRKRAEERNPEFKSRHPGNRVIVIDADPGTVLSSITTGEGPITLFLDTERDRVYVTNRGSGTVTVHDMFTGTLLHTFELPSHPNSLAFDQQNNVLYVSIKNGRDDPNGPNESVARIQLQ